jgi:hypothetical protein
MITTKEDYMKLAELTEVSELYKSLTYFTLKCSAKEVEEINKTLFIIYDRFMVLSKESTKEVIEKKYNYFKDGEAITKKAFTENVPMDWGNEVDEYGEYTNGLYRANER